MVGIAIDIRECTVGVIGTVITIDAESRREAFRALRVLLGAGAPGDIVASAAAAVTLERRFDVAPIGELPQGGGRVYALSGRSTADSACAAASRPSWDAAKSSAGSARDCARPWRAWATSWESSARRGSGSRGSSRSCARKPPPCR